MAIRWIIGRAGTGKTALCVREMRAALARGPLEEAALLWIVPEQATFSSERLLLTGHAPGLGQPLAGAFRAQVLSFRRLALLIARDAGLLGPTGAGRAAATAMDDLARAVLLEEIVRRQRPKLRVFAGVADRPGFIAKLDSTLRELRQHGHSSESLRAMVDSGHLRGEPGGLGGGGTLQLKLLDLADLLLEWEQELQQSGSWDLEALMLQAVAKVPDCPWIAGRPQRAGENAAAAIGKARIWVDAFSTMSTLEVRLLAALGASAEQTTVTLLADPDAPEMRSMRAASREQEAGDVPLFSRTQRLHRRLTEAFHQHKVSIAETIPLRRPYRFQTDPLRQIESVLFAEVMPAPEPAAAPSPAPAKSEITKLENPKRKSLKIATGPTLFDAFEPPADSAAQDNPPPRPAESAGLPIEIWQASDPETEVRLVAQAIRELVLQPAGSGQPLPLRYRNIGIVVPDLEGYQDALRRVFTQHHIPHFVDARRTIAHHPVVEVLRSAVAIAGNRWERDDVLLYLKTRLAGIAQDDVALLENYLIEHAISRVPWNLPWNWIDRNLTDTAAETHVPLNARLRLARINQAREKVHADLAPWLAIAQAPGGRDVPLEATALVQGLSDLLLRLNVEQTLKSWSTAGGHSSEQAELAQIHQQAWREISRLLGLLQTILAGKQRTLADFERLLNSALENLTLGLIPPTVDQVLISSVTRSRVPELEVVFLLGAVEGQLPKVLPEDPILSDAQREAFNLAATELGAADDAPAAGADCIAEGTDRQLLEMPFFDYVAFTRAGQRLIVTYPVADRRGKAVTVSRYVDRLFELLGPTGVVGKAFDAASLVDLDRVATRDDLLTAVVTWARAQITNAAEHPAAAVPKSSAADLYNWLATNEDPAWQRDAGLVWQAIRGLPEPHLAAHWAARFYPPNRALYMSVTQLEKFAACPLQYFLDYTLKLRPREELTLDVLELGTLNHRVLERMYRRIIADDLPWPHCDLPTLRAALNIEVDRASRELHPEFAISEPSYQKTRARIKRALAIVMEADRRRCDKGAIRPREVELRFGHGRGDDETGVRSLQALRVETLQRRVVQVNGKIDRLDWDDDEGADVAVIDYKSAREKQLDLQKVLEGLDLQLPIYALVMRDLDHRLPLAALYYGLGKVNQRPAHAGEIKDEDAFYHLYRPRGMIEAERAFRLDVSLGTGTRSEWYSMAINQDGELSKKSNDLLAAEDFATVLDYAKWKAGQLADELMSGIIAPRPYRKKTESPCEHCAFASLCPFDRVNGTYRELGSMKPAGAVAKMRERKGMF